MVGDLKRDLRHRVFFISRVCLLFLNPKYPTFLRTSIRKSKKNLKIGNPKKEGFIGSRYCLGASGVYRVGDSGCSIRILLSGL